MTRKSGGPPNRRIDEEPWQPPGAEEPLQRSLDLALQRENNDKEEPEFIYGDIVHDTEADEPIALVVVIIPGLTAEEWEFEDNTLADRHDKCPDDDYVVVVVPLDVLEDYMPNWNERKVPIPLEQLAELSFARWTNDMNHRTAASWNRNSVIAPAQYRPRFG